MNFGEQHLNHLCQEFLAYHEERPHQSRENEPIRRAKTGGRNDADSDVIPLSEVRCKQRLGGLLKHYYRKAG